MMDKNQKIQEMQMLEQNLHNLMLQKQAFQMELSETQSALGEMEKSGDEIFKVIGQLMIRTEKEKVKKELLNKEKLIKLRNSTIEKQESSITEQLEKLRKDVVKNLKT